MPPSQLLPLLLQPRPLPLVWFAFLCFLVSTLAASSENVGSLVTKASAWTASSPGSKKVAARLTGRRLVKRGNRLFSKVFNALQAGHGSSSLLSAAASSAASSAAQVAHLQGGAAGYTELKRLCCITVGVHAYGAEEEQLQKDGCVGSDSILVNVPTRATWGDESLCDARKVKELCVTQGKSKNECKEVLEDTFQAMEKKNVDCCVKRVKYPGFFAWEVKPSESGGTCSADKDGDEADEVSIPRELCDEVEVPYKCNKPDRDDNYKVEKLNMEQCIDELKK